MLLDWVNVTAQFENAVDTMLAREMLMREGFAFVHMSAQEAGLCCAPGLTPKLWDPIRYADISHPGDAWSFDMVTQIAKALRAPPASGGLDPMGALGVGSVSKVLAAGQSQSGIRLFDYIDEWLPSHPEAVGLIDGFLVHGDVGKPKRFAKPLHVPVLKLLSDYEAVDDDVVPTSLDPKLRLWEVAGTSHADLFIGYQSIAGHGPRVTAGLPRISRDDYQDIIDAAGNYGEQLTPLSAVCVAAGATMPMHYATSAALHQLNTWAGGGPAPAHGPRFAFEAGALALDQHGNTRGGIRLPPIDVPVARYESAVCQLGGITIPFTDAEIQALYPTHADYLRLLASRSDAAVRAGWLLPDDAVDLMRRACAASNRWSLVAGAASCPPYTPPPFNQASARGPAAPAPMAQPTPATPAPGQLPSTGADGPLAVATLALAAALMIRRARRP